ncbi:MAG: hypothetical protein AAGI14_11640 [Pseudomonadota bacterium]
MSDARLIRALQNGGAVYDDGGGRFVVRRGQDARGRIIGQLASGIVDALVAKGQLKPFGAFDLPRYIWSGPALEKADLIPASIKGFIETHSKAENRSLLGHVLHTLSDRAEASRLQRAADWFYQDHIWEAEGGSVAGMNWQTLALGGRVDRSVTADDIGRDGFHRLKAKERLSGVRGRFSERAYNELYALIMSEHRRGHFAATFAFTPAEADRRAVDLVRRLSWFYEKELAPPEAATPSSGADAAL